MEHTELPEKLNVQSRWKKIKDNSEALCLSDWENGDTLPKMRRVGSGEYMRGRKKDQDFTVYLFILRFLSVRHCNRVGHTSWGPGIEMLSWMSPAFILGWKLWNGVRWCSKICWWGAWRHCNSLRRIKGRETN